MSFLSLIGLMRLSEHEAKVQTLEEILANIDDDYEKLEAEHDRLDDKFKKAVTDLEAEVRASKEKGSRNAVMARRIEDLEAEIAALRPDAEAMRAKRTRDREQKAARRTKAVAVKGKAK